MDIKQAKQELRQTIRAYTARTEDGLWRIPREKQRPVLLMGPPGIGKTAILSQLAQEEHVGLVCYTMTHHTRQSALGLPVIVDRTAAGRQYRATEYTMSEIIASVYEQMEKTGLKTGILFLDEINCVSETLMPAILQMLQNKTFGIHALPEGWMIAAAGNPPRYNQSARSFDMATLDRVRRIDLGPSLAVWQDYAAAHGVHPAVLAYLRLHPEHFFICDAQRAAGSFVTARGWEDLSALLLTYEAWIESEDQLFDNERVTDEELLEEDKEDGMWQVEIMAHLVADNGTYFTREELLFKLHNLMANKELGDHVFFEGIEYEGHECEGYGLIDNEDGIPVFYTCCGS